jgi:hypothetical protein
MTIQHSRPPGNGGGGQPAQLSLFGPFPDPPAHDPHVCGLEIPDHPTNCPGCVAEEQRRPPIDPLAEIDALVRRERTEDTREDALRLEAILECHGDRLRSALLQLLADDILDMIEAFHRGVHSG